MSILKNISRFVGRTASGIALTVGSSVIGAGILDHEIAPAATAGATGAAVFFAIAAGAYGLAEDSARPNFNLSLNIKRVFAVFLPALPVAASVLGTAIQKISGNEILNLRDQAAASATGVAVLAPIIYGAGIYKEGISLVDWRAQEDNSSYQLLPH